LSVNLAKERAAEKAAEIISAFLDHGAKRIGIGTGSTVKLVLRKLLGNSGITDRLARIKLYASSIDTLLYLRSLGLEANTMPPREGLDIYFDGADEVSIEANMCILVKGRGAAMTREKIFAYHSKKVIIVIDESKLSRLIGDKNKPVPVEVLPESLDVALATLDKLNVKYKVRNECRCRDGPALTDNGGIVIDVWPWGRYEILRFESILSSIPGVIGHGIFVGYADNIVVGYSDGDAKVVKCRRTRMNPALKE